MNPKAQAHPSALRRQRVLGFPGPDDHSWLRHGNADDQRRPDRPLSAARDGWIKGRSSATRAREPPHRPHSTTGTMNRRARRRQLRQSAASAGRSRTNNPVAPHADILARAARHMKEGPPAEGGPAPLQAAGGGWRGPIPACCTSLASPRYRCSRFDEAAALLRQATEAAPTYAEAHNSLRPPPARDRTDRRGPRRAGARRHAPP